LYPPYKWCLGIETPKNCGEGLLLPRKHTKQTPKGREKKSLSAGFFAKKIESETAQSSGIGDEFCTESVHFEVLTILLMEDIPNNHLGCIKPCN